MQSVKDWLIDLGLPFPPIGQRRYSSRKATRGSTLVARNAGMTVAPNATATSNTGTTKNVATSLVLTPNSRLAISLQDGAGQVCEKCDFAGSSLSRRSRYKRMRWWLGLSFP
jgi:hypothetical protein